MAKTHGVSLFDPVNCQFSLGPVRGIHWNSVWKQTTAVRPLHFAFSEMDFMNIALGICDIT